MRTLFVLHLLFSAGGKIDPKYDPTIGELLGLSSVGADKPIDPVVAAAWGWTAPEAKPAPAPTVDTYAEMFARVQRGERLVWTGTPPGMAHGTYDCWLVNGVPHMERKGGAVVQTSSFRTPQHYGYYSGHDCPNPDCNASEYGNNTDNGDGSHTHTCRACGSSWTHKNAPSVSRRFRW
jgi:hypothetical protein